MTNNVGVLHVCAYLTTCGKSFLHKPDFDTYVRVGHCRHDVADCLDIEHEVDHIRTEEDVETPDVFTDVFNTCR